MKEQELKAACEVIASYMGYYLNDSGDIWLHDNLSNIMIDHDAAWDTSLDLLVPVWEKLNVEPSFSIDFEDSEERFFCQLAPDFKNKTFESDWMKTIQQAACLATAEAVRGLR